MTENYFYSFGSSQFTTQVKSEQSDSQLEQSNSSKKLFTFDRSQNLKQTLSDLDTKYKAIFCYFNSLNQKIDIDPQECYEFYYSSSFNPEGKFGIIIKNQTQDLLVISQSYPEKKINELEFLATIYGMRYCIDLGIKILNVKGNNQLVSKHKIYQFKSELAIYRDVILEYSQHFNHIKFEQIPKEMNNEAKQLSKERNNFINVLIDQSKLLNLSNSNIQNQPQQLYQFSQLQFNNITAAQKPHLDQIILEYNDIFTEYNKLSIKPINLDQDRDYALIFGKINDNTNKGANFMINQDLNEIIIGTFYFAKEQVALQEISLLYGMRFLLECKITYLNCFTIDKMFCQQFEKENFELSQIREQKCLQKMKQLFRKTNCKSIESTNQLKVIKEAFENKQSRLQILDDSIIIINDKNQKTYQSKTFQKFSQIYSFNK